MTNAEPYAFTARLSVCVDVKHPLAYLALEPVRSLAEELQLEVDWLPFPAVPMQPPPAPDDDRGSRHRRARARYLEDDIQRYAQVQGLTIRSIYRSPDSTLVSLGLLWLRSRSPGHRFDYLQRVFAGYWTQALDVADAHAVAGVLEAMGQEGAAFTEFAAGPGPAELARLREGLVAAGVFTVPSLVVDDQVFVGRAHLPMARWLLTGRNGPPPI